MEPPSGTEWMASDAGGNPHTQRVLQQQQLGGGSSRDRSSMRRLRARRHTHDRAGVRALRLRFPAAPQCVVVCPKPLRALRRFPKTVQSGLTHTGVCLRRVQDMACVAHTLHFGGLSVLQTSDSSWLAECVSQSPP